MSKPTPYLIRPSRPQDDETIRSIIHDVMTEHGCTSDGFAIHDPEVQAMHGAYAKPGAAYFVVEHDGMVLGGAGYARLDGTDATDGICELRKMYFRDNARGLGLGNQMLGLLLEEMRHAGYARCYLETTSWMQAAQRLYRHHGFEELPGPLGATGHHGCDKYFARAL
ncbi:MAG: GNAT family N-acetyltransferase [bacterium]|nr:GNAT family N-acetyltransferase [bacterium]